MGRLIQLRLTFQMVDLRASREAVLGVIRADRNRTVAGQVFRPTQVSAEIQANNVKVKQLADEQGRKTAKKLQRALLAAARAQDRTPIHSASQVVVVPL
jgi:hypothetical protein